MKFEIKNETTVYDGYLKVLRADIEHDMFGVEDRMSVTREACHRGDSCGILLWEEETDSFIFTKQFRYPVARSGSGWMMEIVAGNIEFGEKAEESIRREVEEEIGYTVQDMVNYGSFYLSPGRSTERMNLFYTTVSAQDQKSAGGGAKEEGENIAIVKFTTAKVFEMLQNQQIDDAKTIIALQQYFLLNR